MRAIFSYSMDVMIGFTGEISFEHTSKEWVIHSLIINRYFSDHGWTQLAERTSGASHHHYKSKFEHCSAGKRTDQLVKLSTSMAQVQPIEVKAYKVCRLKCKLPIVCAFH